MASDAVIDKKSIAENPTGYLSEYHRFGWLLFLAFRTHVLSHWQDLVTCSTCLVSILVKLLTFLSIKRLISIKFPISNARELPKQIWKFNQIMSNLSSKDWFNKVKKVRGISMCTLPKTFRFRL